MKRLISLIPCVPLIAACASMQSAGPSASAVVRPASGSQVHGSVRFTQVDTRVRVDADLSGLSPGLHGFHIHEKGDCSAADAMSTGGHFNPNVKKHGPPESAERHGGDLGNLTADASGNAKLSLAVAGISVGKGPDGVIGRGIIVHAGQDDLKTDPTGNAGGRIGCGVIE